MNKPNKLIWTAEDLMLIIMSQKLTKEKKKEFFHNKQFLDADEVKRIIEEWYEADYTLSSLLKRLKLK